MHLIGETLHRLSHTSEEKSLGLVFAAMPVRRSHQFLGFRNGDCGENSGKNGLQ